MQPPLPMGSHWFSPHPSPGSTLCCFWKCCKTQARFCWLPSLAGERPHRVEASGGQRQGPPRLARLPLWAGAAGLGARPGWGPGQEGSGCKADTVWETASQGRGLGRGPPGKAEGSCSGRPEGLRLKAVTVGQVTGTHLMASPGGRGRSKEGGNWEDWLQRKGRAGREAQSAGGERWGGGRNRRTTGRQARDGEGEGPSRTGLG